METPTVATKNHPLPRNASQWSKINKEIEKDEILEKQRLMEPSEEEIEAANKEKDKGNEAFKCGNFDEALVHYNNSIDILPTAASYNNKAITLIKMEKFNEGLEAAEKVVRLEPKNIKAHMRRGIANQALRNLDEALKDFTKVIELEPTNKRGKELLHAVTKEIDLEYLKNKKQGNRVKIEEVTDEPIDETPTTSNRPKIEEVTIEDETEIEPPKKKSEPRRDNAYMDGMYDPKVAEFLAGGKSFLEDDSGTGLHSGNRGGKDFGDKLSNMLMYTKKFIQENKDSVDQEQLNKFK